MSDLGEVLERQRGERPRSRCSMRTRSSDDAEQVPVKIGKDDEIRVRWILPLHSPGTQLEEAVHLTAIGDAWADRSA